LFKNSLTYSDVYSQMLPKWNCSDAEVPYNHGIPLKFKPIVLYSKPSALRKMLIYPFSWGHALRLPALNQKMYLLLNRLWTQKRAMTGYRASVKWLLRNNSFYVCHNSD